MVVSLSSHFVGDFLLTKEAHCRNVFLITGHNIASIGFFLSKMFANKV